LTHDCVRGSGPEYFGDICIPVDPVKLPVGYRLKVDGCATDQNLIAKAFTFAAPVVWNALLVSISAQHLAKSLITIL